MPKVVTNKNQAVTLEQAQAAAYRTVVQIEGLKAQLRELENYIVNYKEPVQDEMESVQDA